MSEPARSALSVVVPVHDGAATLSRCLAALTPQLGDSDELLVVDDASTDDSGRVASAAGVRVVRLDERSGPAAARNRGAAVATRPLLCFIDADVVPHVDVLARGRAHFSDAAVGAVIGSYDDRPEAPGLVSRFKNLAHHYFHQRAAGSVSSFWGACGFVRRDLFERVGGFDAVRFTRPSIEDVELGWRMADAGAMILLDPALQITHLKKWTLRSLLTTEVFRRAVPWIHCALERRRLAYQLNTTLEQRLAAVTAGLLALAAVTAVVLPVARLPLGALAVLAAVLNWRLFALMWRRGGLPLLAAAYALQQLYYLCALAGVAAGLALHWRDLRWRRAARATRVGA